MKRVRLTFIFLIIFGCSNNLEEYPKEEIISGDLYFKIVTMDSIFENDSLLISEIDKYVDSLSKINKKYLSEDQLTIIDKYNADFKKQLNNKEIIYLLNDSQDELIVFIDKESANNLNLERYQLIKNNQKVRIELIGNIIQVDSLIIVNANKINDIQIVDGLTL